MRCGMAVAMALLCTSGGASAWEGGRPPFEPGDVVMLFSLAKEGDLTKIIGVTDQLAWREMMTLLDAHDDVGYEQFEKSGKVRRLESGTKAKVLRYHDLYKIGDDWISECYEVRPVTGPAKDELLWVPEWAVRKLVTRFGPGITGDTEEPAEYSRAVLESNKEIYKAVTRKAVSIGVGQRRLPKGSRAAALKLERGAAQILSEMAATYERDVFEMVQILKDGNEVGWPRGKLTQADVKKAKGTQSSTARVAQKLKLGQALEKTNPAGAIGYYEEVVKLAPGSAEAKKAEARIKAIRAR